MRKRAGTILLAVLVFLFSAMVPAATAMAEPAGAEYRLTANEETDLVTAALFGSGFTFLVNAPEGAALTVTLQDDSQSLGGEPYYLTWKADLPASSEVQRVAFTYDEAAERNVIYSRLNKLHTHMRVVSTKDVTIGSISDFEIGALSNEDCSGFLGVSGEPLGVRGDADLDGTVTVTDALAILRASIGLTELTGQGRALANLDHPEVDEITVLDALLVLRLAVGLSA